jgi:ABC-type multidrug transport system fused ATPase/permease subunit
MNRQQQGGGMSWGRMTVVAIAHCLSTVRRASKIFWIEGRFWESSGKHEELYATCAGYRDAVDGQQLDLD